MAGTQPACIGAVYDASIDQYLAFAGTELGEATEAPIDVAMIDVFVQLLNDRAAGLVADLGCGPGRVAHHLTTRGVPTIGFDVSHRMVSAACHAHPQLPFHTARLDALPLGDGALVGAVSWYSIIHTAPDDLDGLFTEFHRVLKPGGSLLVAFQEGDGDAVVRPDAFGTGLGLTSFRHATDDVIDRLIGAGYAKRVVTHRAPEFPHETTPQAFLIVERSAHSP